MPVDVDVDGAKQSTTLQLDLGLVVALLILCGVGVATVSAIYGLGDPVSYRDIAAGKRPRKIPTTPPVGRGHPPSLERPPAERPWRAADLDYSG